MAAYYEWEGLENVYLEDSWVLGLRETPRQICFYLEAVLTPDHPNYHDPQPDEQYCYWDAELIFDNIKDYTWTEHSMKANRSDVEERFDYGNIDYLYREDGRIVIGGEWGELRISSKTIKFKTCDTAQIKDFP